MSVLQEVLLQTSPLQSALLRKLVRLPAPIQRKLAGGPAPEVDGNRLAPEVELLLAALNAVGESTPSGESVERARREVAITWPLLGPKSPPMHTVEDTFIANAAGNPMRLRSYIPQGITEPSPALVYFHGGGWVLGDIDTHDPVTRCLASDLGMPVFSVDYRLAPEHPFPAGLEDAQLAFSWVRKHAPRYGVDPGRIAVGGDSAGGNFAAVTCQQLLLRGEATPAAQLLLYPGTDFRLQTRSMQVFAKGYVLERANIDWYRERYFGDQDPTLDPRGSPVLAPSLAGLPPAVIVTAGFDVLRDEGEAYAEALSRAGVSVEYSCARDQIHGFANMAGAVPTARQALRDAAARLSRFLVA
ncbi:MAG: alpha/beta hydrolase [Polyangiaceae bacterium]|nr:alpha/beta hydrolase [Polyangiaceae bacterium]MCB9607551.1 alpha/beta hydrolase [Polyangiaceae bacterium]